MSTYDELKFYAQNSTPQTMTSSCFCVGLQNGMPVCPCAMKSVKVIDGRYVRITDLGPAKVDLAVKRGGV